MKAECCRRRRYRTRDERDESRGSMWGRRELKDRERRERIQKREKEDFHLISLFVNQPLRL